jgi:cyclopropane-fatty-acyl-phospholipid synthase
VNQTSEIKIQDSSAKRPREASSKGRVRHLLSLCGLNLDGSNPWDPQVRNPAFFSRVLAQGSLGLGESYMDGWWDAADLDGFLFRLIANRIDEKARTFYAFFAHLKARFLDRQSGSDAYTVGEKHYDLGNDLFQAMLGQRLVYSCGYWRDADSLDSAQEAKLDLVCRKLKLERGMRVLDIGCGWGEALKFAAERYGVSGLGITISRQQAYFARGLCRGLPIDIQVQDYREIRESFDAVYSIGMFEHVGSRHYRDYFEVVRRCLKPEGLSLLHTIGSNEKPDRPDPWIEKYIFPNSQIPSADQVTRALQGLFVVEDWHNFGVDYERTLRAWRSNFNAAWPRLESHYDERFKRMWLFYLGACIATFRARRDQLWQIVLSPGGVPGGYKRIS